MGGWGVGRGSLQRRRDVLLIWFEFLQSRGTQVIHLDGQKSPEHQEDAVGSPPAHLNGPPHCVVKHVELLRRVSAECQRPMWERACSAAQTEQLEKHLCVLWSVLYCVKLVNPASAKLSTSFSLEQVGQSEHSRKAAKSANFRQVEINVCVLFNLTV